jgi:hypothetical protein
MNRINLNDYRKNLFQNEGLRECPHYSEDGVILKIFEVIGVNKNPLVIEFGETRSLGTTTRAFRIIYKAKAIYFTGNLNLKSTILNILDIFKIAFKKIDFTFLKFLFNMPFKFFVTPDNIIALFNKNKVSDIDLLTIDIDSYDYFIAKKVLEEGFKPRLLILEYNPHLPIDSRLTEPYLTIKQKPQNKRVYGASYNALNDLANHFGYTLVHISGFCNLFYVSNDFINIFQGPNINEEIPKNDEDSIAFINKFCQKGFIPTWLGEKKINEQDLTFFETVKI